MFTNTRANETRQWTTEIQSGPFQIHCDFELHDAQTVLAELDAIRADLERLLGVQPREQAIHVVLFSTESEYRRYMHTYFPKLPERRALFIQHRGPGMLFAFWHPDIRADLRHEVTHALINHGNRSLPLWLDEGLAEYFEIEHGRRFRENPNQPGVKAVVKKKGVSSLKELKRIDELDRFTEAHYRDSWAWIHFLIHRRQETRELLKRHLSEHVALRSNSLPAGPDLERELRYLCPNLEAEFREHFENL